MNILITGASGFIGKNLSSFLEARHRLYRLDITKIGRGKRCIFLDLADREKAEAYFKRFKRRSSIDIIVHLASRMMKGRDIEDTNLLYTNLRITEGVIEIAKILKPRKVINFSSMAVYPNIDGKFSEVSEIRMSSNSDCLYGLSKFCGENLIDFLLRGRDVVISHLRIGQVYGRGMRSNRIISVFKRELSKKGRIAVYGEGRRVSNFIDIEKLLRIVNVFIENDLPGMYNVGGENLSYLSLAKNIVKEYGGSTTGIVKVKKGQCPRFFLDTSKLDAILRKGRWR